MSIKNRQVDESCRRKKGIYSVLAIAILLIPFDIPNTDRAVGRVINDLYDRDTFLDKKNHAHCRNCYSLRHLQTV